MITQEEMSSTQTSSHAEGEPTGNSPKRLARIAGVLYLLVGIFGGFAQGFVYPSIYAPGDAIATVQNVLANSELGTKIGDEARSWDSGSRGSELSAKSAERRQIVEAAA